MPEARDFWTLLPVCALAAAVALLAGCGGQDAPEPATEPTDEEWSAPEPIAGSGSPDGDEAVRSADSILADLRTRIAEGQGHADPTFQKNVQDAASVLWDAQADPATLAGAQQHMQIAAIAGEVSRWLAESEGARAEREKSNPTDVAIHDAFLTAAGQGPEAYRAWCAGEGARLLGEHREARYLKVFPPRVDGTGKSGDR